MVTGYRNMALGLTRSPYEADPAATQAGLEYSRHYAKRIKDLGRNSKDTWIKRIWNHVFTTKHSKPVELKLPPAVPFHSNGIASQAKISDAAVFQPELAAVERTTKDFTKEVTFEEAALQIPEMGGLLREKSIVVKTSLQIKEFGSKAVPCRLLERQKTLPPALANSPYINPLQRANYKLERQLELQKAYGVKEYKPQQPIRREQPMVQTKIAQSYLPSITDTGRHKFARIGQAISLEKRAKSIAEKAMMDAKIFTCAGPYPVDAYVRFSLRKRGWVEKFGQHANASSSSQHITESKLECELDEDFEVICEQGVPAPWQEDNGIYAIMSRLVRHYPAKFIWGNRSVNNMTLRNEVVVNHFPKARSFSSKVGLTNSLKELPWLNSGDPMSFFPRCYLLSEDERDDIIEDFQLTACMSLLKWLVRQQQATKAGASDTDAGPGANEPASGEPASGAPLTDDVVTETVAAGGGSMQTCEVVIYGAATDPLVYADCAPSSATDTVVFDAAVADTLPAVNDKHSACTDLLQVPKQTDKPKDVPDLQPARKAMKTVPSKAVMWALQHLNYFIKCKTHDDIDNLKRPRVGRAHWKTLLQWCYEVAQEGAQIVDVEESMFEDSEAMLTRVEPYWPQLEMDSMRNLWIVKPGDKSKGIGIEFCDRLEDILKFTNNSTIQGTYVLQKYIEQPLLIHKVKFDIRQWFLVTEWNPLTVWVYEDCYLRICSQEYSHDTKHEAVHLSNVAIQQHYHNGTRSDKLPDSNYMDSRTFKEYLSSIGAGHAWDDIIYPGMKSAVINTLLATQDVAEHRKSAFELYGADFMLTEDFKPWLLEINSSPGMAPSSKEKAKLCAAVIEDTIKVVLDHKSGRRRDTGGYELAFRDVPMPQFKCIEVKFSVEGQRIRRFDLQRYNVIDQKATRLCKEKDRRKRERRERAGREREASALSTEDTVLSCVEEAGEERGHGDGQTGSESGESPEDVLASSAHWSALLKPPVSRRAVT